MATLGNPITVPLPAWVAAGRAALLPKLESHLALVLRGAWSARRCTTAVRRVLSAEAQWTADFDGEQFALGRAFYTHLETGRASDYFRDAAASDALVESVLPGMQANLRAWAASVVGAPVRPRAGWCGAGVHVFPARGEVAELGGVVHFDTEGLTPHQLATGARALSLVLVLQPAHMGGGLRLWDVRYAGHDHPTRQEIAAPSARLDYRAGDLVVFDSRRLHQIEAFGGAVPRISITLHAVEVDRSASAPQWECWF